MMAINRLYSKQMKTHDLEEKNTMTIGETIRKAIKEVSSGLMGLIGPKDFRLDDEVSDDLKYGMMTKEKPKRARTTKGKYKADNKKTKNVNEAWVGGKAPKKRKK